ncbi:MAG: beta-galactosidase [Capsulimonadaceae bacterium]|nr:beta-galactosidase [Capsulimonadaceae bacterium]
MSHKRSRQRGLAVAAILCGLGCVAQASPVNLVTNASFDIPLRYNGTTLRQISAPDVAYLSSTVARRRAWTPLPAQGWFAEGDTADGISVVDGEAHTGLRCLRASADAGVARSAISSFEARVEPGPVMLTAWVKTKAAKGSLGLDLVNGWQQVTQKSAAVRQSVELPADSGGWTQIKLIAQAPQAMNCLLRLSVSSGIAWLDDVQIVQTTVEEPFNVRPCEWLRLRLAGFDEESLPQIRAGSANAVDLLLSSESRVPLTGKASVWFGPWNAPKKTLLATFDSALLKPDVPQKVHVPIGAAAAGAYVFTVALEQGDEAVLDGANEFHPLALSGGVVSNGCVSSRCALRLAIAPSTRPQDIFGVANGMLGTGKGSWFGGLDPQEFLDASQIGVRCARNGYCDDYGYEAAMGGMSFHVMDVTGVPGLGGFIDEIGKDGDLTSVNPAYPDELDVTSPGGLARLTARARAMGRYFADRPLIASYQMANESPQINRGHLCPSPAADAAFREWCRKRYITIDHANALWNTHYASWNEVEQIVSARFLDEVKAQPKLTGAAAIDWTASTGRLSGDVLKRMNANPGLAMDWLRWRTAVTLNAYQTFHDAAKKISPSTLISTNLCWPDFYPQMVMPFDRAMDVTMLDVQYISGLPRALGTSYEMIDAIEMAESCAPGKPVWGIETYYQPQWPAEVLALQNWGLLAHGMSNNLVFGWKPYSDAGAVKGIRAWEKSNAPPMWFIIDNDGAKLPGYVAYKRSLEEIRAYHERYNGFSIRRAPTDTAFYVSPDTAHYAGMETGNMPWNSSWQRTRNNLIFLLRMHGVAVDYVDDETLPGMPGKYRKIVVPAAYILSQSAASRIASFAKHGGTVILAGASGLRDPWLRPYSTTGGEAWADLGWSAPNFSTGYAPVSFEPSPVAASSSAAAQAITAGKEFRGENFGRIAGAGPIADAAGNTIGWQRPWGAGKLIAYGVFPDTYSGDPHASKNLHAYVADLIRRGDLKASARFVSGDGWVAGAPGTGSPVVEVVVRRKSDREQFLYCLNQGGSGGGIVEAALAPGRWTATDILTGARVKGARMDKGTWSAPLSFGPFGYTIIRLARE